MTHLGSGYEDLTEILLQHPRIDVYQTNFSYDHPDKFTSLLRNSHRANNAASIYLDTLLYNHNFSCKSLGSQEFIYFVRDPSSLGIILEKHPEYNLSTAIRYYCYRLRKLYEFTRHFPGLVLRHSDLGNFKEYLGVRLNPKEMPSTKSNNLSLEALECYERYFKG